MSAPENPPAFPLAAEGWNAPHFAPGMTLRDYFAGLALPPILARAMELADGIQAAEVKPIQEVPALAARLAYDTADAMLAERAK